MQDRNLSKVSLSPLAQRRAERSRLSREADTISRTEELISRAQGIDIGERKSEE